MSSLTRITAAVRHLQGGGTVLFNPGSAPGRLSLVIANPARGGIGGQMASRIAVDRSINLLEEGFCSPPIVSIDERGLAILEGVFKGANGAVYELSQRLAAGGRASSHVLCATIDEAIFSVGRAGAPAAYLRRGNELFAFFAPRGEREVDDGLGARSLISVDLAAIPLEAGDTILIAERELSGEEEDRIRDLAVTGGEVSLTTVGGIGAVRATLEIGPRSVFLSREYALI